MSIQGNRIVKGLKQAMPDRKLLSPSKMNRVFPSLDAHPLDHQILKGTDMNAKAETRKVEAH